MIGFHSVIESPEPVSLVIPPNNTCMIIIPTPINNQIATGRDERREWSLFILGAKVVNSLFPFTIHGREQKLHAFELKLKAPQSV